MPDGFHLHKFYPRFVDTVWEMIMPKIRSVTSFFTLSPENDHASVKRAGKFLEAAVEAFQRIGQPVQSRRLAIQPFPQAFSALKISDIPAYVQALFRMCQVEHIDYLSLGAVEANHNPAYVEALGEILPTTPGVFGAVKIAAYEKGISRVLLQEAARLVDHLGRATPDGMTNLYFAALANCPPGSPFFPVAYHDGGLPRFALAIQAADLAVQACTDMTNPTVARHRLTGMIQDMAETITPVALQLAAEHEIEFGGLDFSLAPYPDESQSLGKAFELLGATFGGSGLVAAAALVMNALESADFMRTGFSGLMLPILEDSVLAARAAEGLLSVNDLLLLSTVCGTGLDCVPLPGDTGVDVLRGILLDVAALSLRLNKPLTARLMPFPGKKAGDALTFDFEYFANSRVLVAPRASSPLGALTGESKADFHILPRPFN